MRTLGSLHSGVACTRPNSLQSLQVELIHRGCAMQIVMRVLLNFSDAFVEDGTMQRIVDLLQTWLDAFVAMPFRIPGFGEFC